MSRLPRVLWWSLALALPGCPRALLAKDTKSLTIGVPLERSLSHGMVHRYEIPVASGQFLHVELEQNHLDVVVRIVSPTGAVLATVENGADRAEPLSLSVVVTRGGIHRVEIRLRSRKSVSGRYTLVVEKLRPATSEDDKRIVAERLRGEADHLLARGSAESSKEAMERYDKALAAWHEVGDRREEAATLARMCDALAWQGDMRPALERAEQALTLWRTEGDRHGEAAALDQVGCTHSDLGHQKLGPRVPRAGAGAPARRWQSPRSGGDVERHRGRSWQPRTASRKPSPCSPRHWSWLAPPVTGSTRR